MNPLKPIVHFVGKRVHGLEYDPVTQFKFHFFFSWLWFVSMICVLIFVPHHNETDIIALAILEVSLWANFVSHMTALGSAIAGIFASDRAKELPGLEKVYEEEQAKIKVDIERPLL